MISPGLLLALLLTQTPPAEEAKPPRGMSRARLYLGPAAGQQGGAQVGQGGVLGFQGFTELSPSTSSFWGVEILGVQVGSGALPIFTGDLGLRYAPWPHAFLRPYGLVNLGISFLIIIPVPSLSAGVGVALPIGDVLSLDLGLRVRHALNIFNLSDSVNIAAVELGLGF
ncbi:MAG: hypothetical protein M3Y59_14615 [Myxococcota bacterium]|nr:hypothetical protein [Myxococcota bacterium]